MSSPALPPLPALRAFEAVARHLSFTAAAVELGITQAAVSHQIKALEGMLGAPVFLRQPRGIALTALGARLARPTTLAFNQLRDAFAEEARLSQTLTISSFSSVAANWLAQRIGRFQMAHPDLAVRLEISDSLIDFDRSEVDVAIRHGRGDWPGLVTVELFPMVYTPILSPARLAEWGPLQNPEQIMPLPWLNNQNPMWMTWLHQAGVSCAPCDDSPLRPSLGSQVNESRAALAGEGIAMLSPRFFQFELATGSLVQPFEQVYGLGHSSYLVYPEARRNRPAIRHLRQFLLAEAAAG